MFHEFKLEIEAGLTIRGSAQDLSSIFSTLLNNARFHTPKGTRVTVRAYRSFQHNIFEVKDEGPGIPEYQIKHLTEMLYQAGARLDSTKEQSALNGFGLPIVANLLRRHHGKLTIHSNFGQGALFRCTIPLV